MHKYMKEQGNMKCDVESLQSPEKAFTGKDMGKTTEYISRQDKRLSSEAAKINKQKYVGRYE